VGHGTATRAQTCGLEAALEALWLANWDAVNEMCVRRSSGRRKSGTPYLWTARGDGGNVNSPAATTCTWRMRRGSMLADAELQDTQPAVPRSATVAQPEFDFELQGSGRSSARRHVEEASDRSSNGMHMARAARPHARRRRAAGHADCSASTRCWCAACTSFALWMGVDEHGVFSAGCFRLACTRRPGGDVAGEGACCPTSRCASCGCRCCWYFLPSAHISHLCVFCTAFLAGLCDGVNFNTKGLTWDPSPTDLITSDTFVWNARQQVAQRDGRFATL